MSWKTEFKCILHITCDQVGCCANATYQANTVKEASVLARSENWVIRYGQKRDGNDYKKKICYCSTHKKITKQHRADYYISRRSKQASQNVVNMVNEINLICSIYTGESDCQFASINWPYSFIISVWKQFKWLLKFIDIVRKTETRYKKSEMIEYRHMIESGKSLTNIPNDVQSAISMKTSADSIWNKYHMLALEINEEK